jgi:transcription antitermination factor NusG
MAQHWYALRSKPRKEEALFQHASAQGFEVFYPRIPVKRANPRARTVAPFFPGYMFVHVNLAEVGTSAFEWMPHAIGLVSFGDEPATVDAELIEVIQYRVHRIASVGGEVFMKLRPGDRVEITHGPFLGYDAIFDARLSGDDRVRVLLDMLNGRTVPMELRVGELRRVA